MLGGVRLIEREAHRDAHPEVLWNLQRVTVATLDAVAVVESHDADVLEKFVVHWLECLSEGGEVEELGESRVEQLLLDATGDVRGEATRVQCLELLGGLVVAEHSLVDGLEQQAGGHCVEGRVVFHVLECDLDDGLVELLRRDAVEEGELEFARDLGDPGDVVVQSGARVLDREVDLVGVVRLALSIALDYGDCHVCSLCVLWRPETPLLKAAPTSGFLSPYDSR